MYVCMSCIKWMILHLYYNKYTHGYQSVVSGYRFVFWPACQFQLLRMSTNYTLIIKFNALATYEVPQFLIVH